MSIIKNQNTGKYDVVYRYKDFNGKSHQSTKRGFETKDLAVKFECMNKLSYFECTKVNLKFKDLYSFFINDCINKKANTTISGFNYCYNKYFKVFDNLFVKNITLKVVEEYRNSLLKNKLSIYRCNFVFKLLSRILNYGIKHQYINNNVCNSLDLLKDYSVKNSKVDFYTLDEFKHFISFIPSDNKNSDYVFFVMFNVLYYTGLRSGELLALNVTDIDLENSYIKVNKSLARLNDGKYELKTTKTDSSTNNAYIPSSLLNILKEYLFTKKNISANKPLFVYNNRRVAKRTLDNKKNYYCNLANIRRIRLHDFRHSFASLIYELSNFNYSEVAKRLRHSNLSTVMKTYIHVFPFRKNEVDHMLDSI